ncbi:MAG: choice-of-anchor D domain-containing protein [Acidobacteriia bacterium]|nr:choice-of-anchor D domain-containing protein [Terriglobia bacterium]
MSNSALDFGNVVVDGSKTLTVTVTNETSSGVTLVSAAVSKAAFTLTAPTLPVTIAAGQSTALSISFTPNSTGTTSATLTIESDAPTPEIALPLSGNGVIAGELSANPTSLSFGSIQVGNSQTLSETLTNSGGADVTITQATTTGLGFSASGLSLPVTLSAGESKTFSVIFAPQSLGGANGNIAITSDASNPTLNVPLSGTGIAVGALTANPTSLNFGSVQVGSNQTLSETLTNTGGSSVTISQATATGPGFSVSGLSLPLTLSAGQSKTFSVTFAPQSAGSASGNVAITSNGSNPILNVPLSGTGVTAGALTANPSSLSFGSVQTGSSSTLSETLTNTGGSSVTITQATATGAGFSVSGLSLPLTLTAGQSKTFSVTFAPQSAGSVSGNLAIISNGSNPTLNIPLSGTGVAPGALTANPSSLSFGSIQIGNSSTLSETVTNTGGSSVTITQATTTGAGFSVSGLSLPLTLTAGQSKTFSVTFAPQSAGSVSGNIAVISNASNPTLNIPLSGTGVTQGALSANPTSLSFGNVQVGNSSTLSETLTNTGGSSVTITQATATGAGLSVSGLSLPLTLTAGQAKTFSVVFAPSSAGSVSGNLAIISNGSNPTLNIPLSGTGITAGTLTANPTSLSFGSVQIGNSSTLSETLTNTGGSSVTISQATTTGAGLSVSGLSLPLTLTAGQSKTFSVVFAPLSAGSVSGNLAIISNGSNPTLNIPLSGTGVTQGTLSANPSTLSFGNVQVGTNKTLSETLTNTGGSNVTISQATASGTGFSISGLTPPITLTPGQSFTFSAIFAPTTASSANGSITVVSDASNPNLTISMSGTGTAPGQLSVTPTSLSFGDVVVGGNSSQSGTLNATGASVTVSSVSISSPAFSVSGLSFPFTITAGGSANFTVTFAPSATGPASGTVSFTSNASNSPTVQSVTGNGTSAPQHSVDLSWNASTSVVDGYNIYRSTTSGGTYSKLNSTLNPGTAYTDSTVQAGKTYYYVTTAVDSSGGESIFSNEVQAIIPTP